MGQLLKQSQNTIGFKVLTPSELCEGIYALCFCKESKQTRRMWDEYGKKGTGIRIGFNTEQVLKGGILCLLPSQFQSIRYGRKAGLDFLNKEHLPRAQAAAKELVNRPVGHGGWGNQDLALFQPNLVKLPLAFIKKYQWHNERENRLIRTPDITEIKYRNDTRKTPYFPINLNPGEQWPITEIAYGPKCLDAEIKNLQSLLKKNEYDKIIIKSTQIS